MNFYKVEAAKQTSNNKKCDWIVSVDFTYGNNKDIVCKGGAMHAFWYDGKWNTSEYDLLTLIDNDIMKKVASLHEKYPDADICANLMSSNKTRTMKEFKDYTKLSPQSEVQFNKRILFSSDVMKKSDYATTQLSYTPTEGETPAFDELTQLLYDEVELEKILWFMGALLTNNMKNIQKFLYLYGGKGTGKGTIINIFKMLFESYWAPIDLNNLTSDGSFATSEIKELPLLIDDDTDLSNIKKDTNLLKLTAHEPIIVNSKYKQTYITRFDGLLITASNQRFKVRNIDSGITRRAVVASPTNQRHSPKNYNNLMARVKYELPMIAYKAMKLFEEKGVSYYESYVDYEMIEATDYFYSFVRDNAIDLGDPCSLKRAAELYKVYVDDLGYESAGYKRKVKNELKRYYNTFYEAKKVNGDTQKNIFEGFKWDVVFPDHQGKNVEEVVTIETLMKKMNIIEQDSIFDQIAKDYQAQLTTEQGTPIHKWDDVTTTLNDIDTKQLHFIRLPLNHIVVDFDLKENGEKDLLKNLTAIQSYPKTYTELSKSGKGIHLHYIYEGDVTKLAGLAEEDVEIKVHKGRSSLRRKLTKCNDLPIAHISSGLPLKEEKLEVYKDIEVLKLNEQKMRALIKGNLAKKYHNDTRSSISFIAKVFNDAKRDGVEYDLRDMRQDVLAFAAMSSNQAVACINDVAKMDFCTVKNEESEKYQKRPDGKYNKEDLYFYDVEVYSNLFLVVLKKYKDDNIKYWFNPTPEEIEKITELPLVGFNNRRYDNHIMYARLLGENNLSLYRQSQRIISKKDNGAGMYSGAYELSYTDIYDYCSAANKKSLKKWEVELGIKHDEIEFPWDQPVDESNWPRVLEYCINDVRATEAVFDATESDYKAREILSMLSGLSMNATTNQHTTAIIFEGNRNTKNDLVYTNLSETFPGYTHSFGKSDYLGEDPSEGGYVYAEPGIYENVGLFDVMSMHPFSAIALKAFGKYTKNFEDLVQARIYIKHGELDKAGELFGGRLKPYLADMASAKALSNALKTAINSVYGLTKASFDNPFRHPLNVDNIIAKRGALFMMTLKKAVQDLGYTVAHIKTDSIKIPNYDDKVKEFILNYGKKYGYTFEHEDTYKVLALINKSTYVCQNQKGEWSATGTEFIQPYVFKRLFSKEEITEKDVFLIKEVKDASIFLGEKFVGHFVEVYASLSGEELFRVTPDSRSYLNGTKGARWKLSNEFTTKEDIDFGYYETMVDDAMKALVSVGDVSKLFKE